MTSKLRITSALVLMLSTAPLLAAEYHGPKAPNFDDATYYFEETPPTASSHQSLPYDFTTMKVDESAVVETPREGTQIRTAYDDTTMKFVEISPDPMEQ